MSEAVGVNIALFGGPSLHAPYAAVAADFRSPFPSALPPERLQSLCTKPLPRDLLQLVLRVGNGTFEHAAVALASAVQDLSGPNRLPKAHAGSCSAIGRDGDNEGG